MDNYKSVHELVHSDLDSKIIKIYGFMDRIDPEPIEKAINKNASDLNAFSNYSNMAIDALIRITRMLGLSFIVLVIGFLAALLTDVIPVIFGKIVTGALVICCMGFILFEAKYIMKYINLASSTLKKMMLMMSE